MLLTHSQGLRPAADFAKYWQAMRGSAAYVNVHRHSLPRRRDPCPSGTEMEMTSKIWFQFMTEWPASDGAFFPTPVLRGRRSHLTDPGENASACDRGGYFHLIEWAKPRSRLDILAAARLTQLERIL